ncbi:MAG: hypothetical protein IKS51_01890 [Erysipelotrichaceae bacterium]|nr:hypothetical protein [Erysipelotrichaceae bacterium]
MLIKIGKYSCSEVWDGVFYKTLSDYPKISDWEIQSVLDFIRYEEKNGRTCQIEAPDSILGSIEKYRNHDHQRIAPTNLIQECTACPIDKGCKTDLVCHTSPLENALQILDCGSLLSPVKTRNMTAAELQKEARNAANDPADYFDCIMFSWGNCQAGDRLVMERKLGRFPEEKELGPGFTPGVRFFFRYDELIKHPDVIFDGVLPLRIRNKVILKDWVHAIIVPVVYRNKLEPHLSEELRNKVHYLDHEGMNIWEWSHFIYSYLQES